MVVNIGACFSFDLDPEVFPIYIGLPWGLAIGPLPNFPFPVQIHTRVCPPIVFERYGRKAASDRAYVDACYQKVPFLFHPAYCPSDLNHLKRYKMRQKYLPSILI